MKIESENIDLVRRVLNTDDESVLTQLRAIFENHNKDFWNDLQECVKAGIERGKQQAKAGLVTPHYVVMKKYDKYL